MRAGDGAGNTRVNANSAKSDQRRGLNRLLNRISTVYTGSNDIYFAGYASKYLYTLITSLHNRI